MDQIDRALNDKLTAEAASADPVAVSYGSLMTAVLSLLADGRVRSLSFYRDGTVHKVAFFDGAGPENEPHDEPI